MKWKRAIGPVVAIAAVGVLATSFLAKAGLLSGPEDLREEQAKLHALAVPVTLAEGARLRMATDDPRNSAPFYEEIETRLEADSRANGPLLQARTARKLMNAVQIKQAQVDLGRLHKILALAQRIHGKEEFQGSFNYPWQDGSHTRYCGALVASALLHTYIGRPLEALDDVQELQEYERRMTRQLNLTMPMSTIHLDATIWGLLSEIVGVYYHRVDVIDRAQHIYDSRPPFDVRRSYILRPSTVDREFAVLLSGPPPPYEEAAGWYKIGFARSALQARYLRSMRLMFEAIPSEPTQDLASIYLPLDGLVKAQAAERRDYASSLIEQAIPNWSQLARETREAHSRRKLAKLGLLLAKRLIKGDLPAVAQTTDDWIDPMSGKPFEYRHTSDGFLLSKADDGLVPNKALGTPLTSLPFGYEALWQVPLRPTAMK